jgi:hypothetical protein
MVVKIVGKKEKIEVVGVGSKYKENSNVSNDLLKMLQRQYANLSWNFQNVVRCATNSLQNRLKTKFVATLLQLCCNFVTL